MFPNNSKSWVTGRRPATETMPLSSGQAHQNGQNNTTLQIFSKNSCCCFYSTCLYHITYSKCVYNFEMSIFVNF